VTAVEESGSTPNTDGSPRVDAAEAYVQAFRTGEGSAARRASGRLSSEVRLVLGSGELTGHDEVLAHITGIWPYTSTYAQGGWSAPVDKGDDLEVQAVFPALGAAPRSARLTFSFDGDDKIVRVVEELELASPPVPADRISLPVRGAISGALANGTPMVVAYTGADGSPVLSLRGSVVVYSDTQLAIWLRNATGGLASVVAERPGLSLLYRDSKTRTTLVVRGRGHIASDPGARDRVFELTPEVEQLHDVGRRGAALVIDVTEIRGTSPGGPILIQP
jgi:hypothetical protein